MIKKKTNNILPGNFPTPKPPPTFVPPITTGRPTVGPVTPETPATPADEKTTPNDNNLPPGPD